MAAFLCARSCRQPREGSASAMGSGEQGNKRSRKKRDRSAGHSSWYLKRMAGTTGLEPATSAVTGQRSNQLNYVPRATSANWWAISDSNGGPSGCKPDALTAELTARTSHRSRSRAPEATPEKSDAHGGWLLMRGQGIESLLLREFWSVAAPSAGCTVCAV